MSIDNFDLNDLIITKEPIYEYQTFWAEEGSTLNSNSAEWSYGNNSTGYTGLPVVGEGWEIFEMGFNADLFAANASITVAVCNHTTPTNAIANVLATISLASPTDGFGSINNAAKIESFLPAPISVPDPAIIGFRTVAVTGTVRDARVIVRLRRKLFEAITDIQ